MISNAVSIAAAWNTWAWHLIEWRGTWDKTLKVLSRAYRLLWRALIQLFMIFSWVQVCLGNKSFVLIHIVGQKVFATFQNSFFTILKNFNTGLKPQEYESFTLTRFLSWWNMSNAVSHTSSSKFVQMPFSTECCWFLYSTICTSTEQD